MKHFSFLILFVLFLTGCSFTSPPKSSQTTIPFTGKIYPDQKIVTYHKNNHTPPYTQSEGVLLLTGSISNSTPIGDHVYIEDNMLIYSGLFSFSLPYTFKTWEYYTGIAMESLSLMNKKHFVHLSVGTSISTQRSDEKTKCEDTIGELIHTTSKISNGKGFYITSIKYPESSSPIKELCFVNNNLIYRISSSDSTFMTKIITSFLFDSQLSLPKTPDKQSDYLGRHSLIPQATGMYSNIIVSGNSLVYQNFFLIKIPKRLQFRQLLYPSSYPVDLFLVDEIFYGFNIDKISFLHLIITPLSSKKEPNELQTCLALQGNISPNLSTTQTGTYTTYIMYRDYDSFGYLWKQGDICFIDDRFVYNISVRLPDVDEVKYSIESFSFLE